jgi:hypothetical protein
LRYPKCFESAGALGKQEIAEGRIQSFNLNTIAFLVKGLF